MNNQSGQILVEQLLGLPLMLVIWVFSLAWLFAWGGVVLMEADLFSLARSSLYGAERDCSPNRHWPQLNYVKIEYQCSDKVFEGEIMFMDRQVYKKRIQLEVTR